MSFDANAHKLQMAILKHLLLSESARFSELQKAINLTSDHANFHIRFLVSAGHIKKQDDRYELTIVGKEYANRMDTDNNVLEKQAKVAVLLIIEDKDGRIVAQQRLKQPYFGFWGRPTGKIRWGETVLQAAARELAEETSLTADLEFKGVYHKMDYRRANGEILEDKYFNIVYCTNPNGELSVEFEGGRNEWLTNKELEDQDKVFEDITKISDIAKKPGIHFIELKRYYEDKDY